MRKIAIANRKGGVGKTTTAVHLAYCLATAEKKILLIDTDTQAHCSKMLGVQPEKGLADLMDGAAKPTEVITEARENLWLLAGGRELAGISRLISRKDFKSEEVLSEALAPYNGDLFDFVILDTAPGYSPLSINVLFYADEIACPVSMEALSVEGLGAFLEELEPIKRYSRVDVKYIMPTFLDGRVKKSEEILEQLRVHFAEEICEPIRYSVRISECSAWGKTIHEYARKDRGALDYDSLARRVENG